VVLTELLKDRGLLPDLGGNILLFAMIEDESLRESTLGLVQALRDQCWEVDYPIVALKPNKQFKRAIECGARFTIRMENKETVTLKDLKTKQEGELPISELSDRIIKAICPGDSE
jgi:histidyl-tRNA synthetase